ncbi:MAG: hypothetical protein KME27_16905 [Lyngbya sp. HA4199-MV5]|nr:hypothetical protein [Lyngbya sp. HA4199-MV5]
MSYLTSLQASQLLTIASCSCCAFFLVGFFCWSLWRTLQEGFRYLRRLHQVPCDRCRYFTGEQLLKCTVHPCKAFSEAAIDCLDFEMKPSGVSTMPYRRCQTNVDKERSLSQQMSQQNR